MNITRVAYLLRELADALEEGSAEPTAPKSGVRRRIPRERLEPTELDVARAKAALKRLGMKAEAGK